VEHSTPHATPAGETWKGRGHNLHSYLQFFKLIEKSCNLELAEEAHNEDQSAKSECKVYQGGTLKAWHGFVVDLCTLDAPSVGILALMGPTPTRPKSRG